MALLPEVAELYEALKRDSESQLLVKVTSAMALDAAQAEQLKASLKRRFKREIELETQCRCLAACRRGDRYRRAR